MEVLFGMQCPWVLPRTVGGIAAGNTSVVYPYTQGLIRSIPRIDTAAVHKVRLEAIPGTVPKLVEPAEGCRFADRCRHVRADCRQATPALREIEPGHKVACFHAEGTS
jgi:peptide/nickel transport system ATP-binding protein